MLESFSNRGREQKTSGAALGVALTASSGRAKLLTINQTTFQVSCRNLVWLVTNHATGGLLNAGDKTRG